MHGNFALGMNEFDLPADVHQQQQLCNNNPMARLLLLRGRGIVGLMSPLYPLGEPLQVYFHPIVSFRILMGLYLCESSRDPNEQSDKKPLKWRDRQNVFGIIVIKFP